MALIKCEECGKEVSDKATSCPNCGCPIAKIKPNTEVRIKMPNIELGTLGLFSSRDAIVKDNKGKILWKGQHGQTAKFNIEEVTDIIINLGGWANETKGNVEPGKKYSMVQDLGIHWLATYRLTEVDVIDSD